MELTQVPETVKRELANNLGNVNRNWTRGLAAGSLITGAVLLASGKRKSGFAVTAVGALVALFEDTDNVREIWEQLPGYLQNGQQMLGRVETFVRELAEQGERIRKIMNQAG
jgi:hypothetical protein